MEHMVADNPSEVSRWLKLAAEGNDEGWRALISAHGDRLRRMVSLRLDPRLQGRVDPSDVLQDVYLEASEQLPEYVRDPTMPFFLWLRYLTGHNLGRVHRFHLGTQARDAGRDISIYRGTLPEASSAALAAQLLGHESRPSEIAQRLELKLRLQEALNQMDAIDREVLSLRHFEQLTRAEAAKVLGISEAAAGKRYLRAVARLKEILSNYPGGLEGL